MKCKKCGGSGIYVSEHDKRCWDCGGSGKDVKAHQSKFENEMIKLITDTFGFTLNEDKEIVGDEYIYDLEYGGSVFLRYKDKITTQAIYDKENYILGFKHSNLPYGGNFIFHCSYKVAPDFINEYLTYCEYLEHWLNMRGLISMIDKRYKRIEKRFKEVLKDYEYQF